MQCFRSWLKGFFSPSFLKHIAVAPWVPEWLNCCSVRWWTVWVSQHWCHSVSCQACCHCPGNWAETSREVVACREEQPVEASCNFCGGGCVHRSGLCLARWHSWLTVLVWGKSHLSEAVGLSLGELPADRIGGSLACSAGFCVNSFQNCYARKNYSLLPTSDSTSGYCPGHCFGQTIKPADMGWWRSVRASAIFVCQATHWIIRNLIECSI